MLFPNFNAFESHYQHGFKTSRSNNILKIALKSQLARMRGVLQSAKCYKILPFCKID